MRGGHSGGRPPAGGGGGGRFPPNSRVVCDTCGESMPLHEPNNFMGFSMNHSNMHPDHHGFHMECGS